MAEKGKALRKQKEGNEEKVVIEARAMPKKRKRMIRSLARRLFPLLSPFSINRSLVSSLPPDKDDQKMLLGEG